MFSYTKRKISDTQGDWTGGPRLWRAFYYDQEPNIICLVAKLVFRDLQGRGGQQVMHND